MGGMSTSQICLNTGPEPTPSLLQLGQPFQKAADEVFNRLYQAAASQPIYIHVDESVPLDARLMNRLLKAIRNKRRVSFH